MEFFCIGMANHLWQSSVLILLLLGIERMMEWAPGRWLERLWLVGLAGLLIPIFLLRWELNWLMPSELESVLVVLTLPQKAVQVAVPQNGASFLWPLLSTVWLLGVLIHWVILARNLNHLRCWKDQSLAALPSSVRAQLESQIHSLGITKQQVRWTSEPKVPMVMGLLRPRIVLPLSLIHSLHTDQMQAVLLHEVSHLRRRDPLRLLGYSLVQSVLFFHPLWPLVQRRLKNASEFICDENSLATGMSGQRYAQTLFGAMALELNSPLLSTAAGLRCRTSLSSRINRFHLKEGKENMLRYRLLLGVAMGILVFGMMVSIGCETETPVQETAISNSEVKSADLESVGEFTEQALESVTENLVPPEMIHWVAPEYPDQCRKEGITGTVVVKVLVNEDGSAQEAKVIDGPDCLREAALLAAQDCRFKPGSEAGEPVKAWVALPYQFRLQ